jgi:hypothetical protein
VEEGPKVLLYKDKSSFEKKKKKKKKEEEERKKQGHQLLLQRYCFSSICFYAMQIEQKRLLKKTWIMLE